MIPHRLCRPALLLLFVLFAHAALAATVAEIAPRSAPPGARVIVAGSGLDDPAIGVTFAAAGGNRAAAAVILRTASLLEVRVPDNAVSGEIRAASGTTALGAFAFTVTAHPPFVKSATLAAASKSHDSMKEPFGPFVALPNGITYFADSGHHQIRAVLPGGEVQLSAGTGKPGLVDGPAASAQFKSPQAVVIDRARNVLYIADTGNHVIRALTLAGTVSTFAGSGRGEDRDGTGQQASFKQPGGLAIDRDGNLYVADTGNDKIRKITPAGVVTTFAGAGRSGSADGAALQALFKKPQGIAVAGGGVVYVADSGNQVIRKIENGGVTTFAGSGQNGSADGALRNASFKEPAALALDEAGDLFIADSGNHLIRRISGGNVTTIAGGNNEYKQPSGIASEGALYIADTKNDALRVLYRAVVATDVYPRSGDPAGSAVIRLFGAGFVPGQTTVTFGGASAQVTYVSSTELMVTTPAGALGSIAITTPAGTATLNGVFNYVPPFVALTVSPAAPSLDPNQTLQLSAAGVLAGGGTTDITTRVTWTSSATNVATIDATGLVRALTAGTTTITAALGGLSATATLIVRDPSPIPPDPGTVAPPLNPSGGTSIGDSTSFLYTGPNPIQRDVAPGTIRSERVGVIRGRVVTAAGAPLGGVRVRVAAHPEYGTTFSRADGAFDLAVNGGETLTVRCDKDGFLSADRQIQVPWQDFAVIDEDIRLLALDASATAVTSNAASLQIARGSAVTDSSGTRRATMLFFPGTSATMELSDGTTQPLSTLTVRATEYSVGVEGAKSMPAPLPPQSAYTYCAELSVDQARAAGAKTVRFSQPVAFYLENFLGFPAGTFVPAASYDREKQAWIASPDGRVIRIVAIESGAARVDTDGDGAADDTGMSLEERQQIASLYTAGTTLWRVMLSHFSPVDLNFPVAVVPDPNARTLGERPVCNRPGGCPSVTGGSIIECENKTLGEDVGITGTPFALHYRSDRTAGRIASQTMEISLTPAQVPASLLRVEVEINIAGRTFREIHPAMPNRRMQFTWDGRDAYGREVNGARPVTVRVSYWYPAVYEFPASFTASFGQASGLRSLIPARLEVAMTQIWLEQLGSWTAEGQKLGGWTITPHHFYDVAGKTLHRGDGSRESEAPLASGNTPGIITTIAGTGVLALNDEWVGAGGPARNAKIGAPNGMAVGPDGTLYISSDRNIHKITPDGTLVRIAGGQPGHFPPTPQEQAAVQPALNARLYRPHGLAVGPDGSVYIAESWIRTIRRITPDGMIRPFAGVGGNCNSQTCFQDKVPATEAGLLDPSSVAVAPDGSVYIADSSNERIRRVGPDGLISTVAGTGVHFSSGDGGPATAAAVEHPDAVLVAPDGSLLVAEARRIRRIAPDGIISTLAGNGSTGRIPDGSPANGGPVRLNHGGEHFFSLGPDGSMIFGDGPSVRRLDPAGIITTLAGTDTSSGLTPSREGIYATATNIPFPEAVTTGPDGTIYFHESNSWKIKAIRPSLPLPTGNTAELRIANGRLVHVFDRDGRHLRTTDADTGATLYRFTYSGGLLASITDAANNVTQIERDPSGFATAIVAPGAQRTTLDPARYATSITTAPGVTTRFTYTPQGLMQTMVDPRDSETTFTFNADGLLQRDADPEGGAKDIVQTATADGQVTEITTALGRKTRYEVQQPLSGATTRRIIDAAGLVTTTINATNGTTVTTFPDGSTLTSNDAPDPLWNMQSPFTGSMTLRMPSGKSMTVQSTRNAATSVAGNPDSLTARTDEVTMAGRTFTRVFDRATLTETLTSAEQRVVTLERDSLSRVRRMSLPRLAPVVYAYDAKGRPETVTRGTRQQTYTWNAKNEIESVRDSIGRTTRFHYDSAGRIIRQVLPDLSVVVFAYDANGNLTSLTPPARPAHAFAYTKVNLGSTYTPPALPGTSLTRYRYNKDRDLTTIERPDGSTISFGYDSAGRLQSISSPDGARTWSYLGTGAVGSVTGGDASLSFAYDGSLPTSMSWSGAVSGTISWAWGDDLRLASETTAGQSVAFSWDDDGLLTDAGPLSLGYYSGSELLHYTSLGTAEDWRVPNEYGEVMQYGVSNGNDDDLLVFDYTRDASGRITAVTETHPQTGTAASATYDYDDRGRLTDVVSATRSAHYSYDDNGNRLAREVTIAGTTTNESATYDDQDRLLTHGGSTFNWTPNGELLSKTDSTGTTTYDYDSFGNLLHVTLPDGTAIDYVIDALNRRVGRKVNGTMTHRWLYADPLRILAELDGSGTPVSRFVYATRSNVPDYMVRGGVTYRIFSDHLGSPRVVVNSADGAVVQIMEYDELGNVVADSNPGFQPFGFAGGLYDARTKLLRFGARDYDAGTGRWTAKDPVGFAAGDANIYAYVGNDPVNLIDPSGLRPATPGEIAFLQQYFGSCLDYNKLQVNLKKTRPKRAWSPSGYNVNFPAEDFQSDNYKNELDLADSEVASTLAHEALHVFQRTMGARVTGSQIIPQARFSLGGADPYKYDSSITDPQKNLDQFLDFFKASKYEAQGQMWQDMVKDDIAGSSMAKWNDILSYVKKNCSCKK